MNLKSIISCLFILNIMSIACLAEDTISSASGEKDLSVDKLRIPGKERIMEIMQDEAYQYESDYKSPKDRRFMVRLFRWLSSPIRLGLKTIKYWPLAYKIIIVCIFIVFLFVVATRTKLYKIIYNNREPESLSYRENIPINEEFDYDGAVSMLVSTGDYRSAVRLLHLKILNSLHKFNVIKLSQEKTNREYLYEISDPVLRKQFIELTSLYNKVWYGKYNPQANEYEMMAPGFHSFIQSLNAKTG